MLPPRRLGLILAVALMLAAPGGAAAEPAESHGAAATARSKSEHGKDRAGARGSAAKDAATAKGKGAKGKGAKGAQSIGAPNAGKLAGSIRLRGSRYLRQREGAYSWGLPALVRLVQHAAARVARKHRSSVMLVGDLSGRAGGPIDGHDAHQSGRDVDIGFYVMNSKGKPVNVRHFVAFDSSGKGRELPWATFDEARNWLLIESLLSSERADVQHIFLSGGLRARLLAYAARKHVPKEIVSRAASVMMSSREGEGRDDHLHVRIACPASMGDACVEEPVAKGSKAAVQASSTTTGA